MVGQYWKKNGRGIFGRLGRTKNDIIQNDAEDYLISNIRSGDILITSLRLPFYFGANGFASKEKDFIYKNNNGEEVSRKDFFEMWQRKVFDLASNLEVRNAKLIITTPTPEWKNSQSCNNIQWFNKLSTNNCVKEKIFFDREYESIITFLERLEQQNKNVFLLDSLSALCSNGLCEYKKDNEALYRDTDHLSNYASRNIIGPILVDLIKKI